MFDGPRGISNAQECKPDYQEQAARLKKRIDADKNFTAAFLEFVENGSFHSARSDDAKPLYAIIGALATVTPGMEREYAILLERVERE